MLADARYTGWQAYLFHMLASFVLQTQPTVLFAQVTVFSTDDSAILTLTSNAFHIFFFAATKYFSAGL